MTSPEDTDTGWKRMKRYADPKCPDCKGTGVAPYKVGDVESVTICSCVTRNLEVNDDGSFRWDAGNRA